jgi:hypothetical protein
VKVPPICAAVLVVIVKVVPGVTVPGRASIRILVDLAQSQDDLIRSSLARFDRAFQITLSVD